MGDFLACFLNGFEGFGGGGEQGSNTYAFKFILFFNHPPQNLFQKTKL